MTEKPDKDLPLREDIRLLGRLLGDTVRQQEGDEAFEMIERIRRDSIAFHRDNNEAAHRQMESMLSALSVDETMIVVRAFSYFSHLANVAEDLHHIRRSREHQIAGSAPRAGSLAHALNRTSQLGVDSQSVAEFFRQGLISPVLTAHPTKVQRKSVLNTEMEIADLLDARDRVRQTPEERLSNDESVRRCVLALWQTRMLRLRRLAVLDEVANGLSFYDRTFLKEIPLLYAKLEDEISLRQKRELESELPTFLYMGSWIGGDRDGNPFVKADVLQRTLRMQSSKIFTWYLEQLHELGFELPSASTLVEVTPEMEKLAVRSPDENPQRADEPYRRAITGMYARIAATASKLDQLQAMRHAVGDAPAYGGSDEFASDLDVLHRSLEADDSALLARGRLRQLRRAARVFGFHLATVDLRQNSDVHERVVAELFAASRPEVDYLACDEDARVELLSEELQTARPLVSPYLSYSEETASELAISRTAAMLRDRYGAAAIRTYIISKTDQVSDILEATLLAKEAGMMHPGESRLDINIVPLFETIEDLRNAGSIMETSTAFPGNTGAIPNRVAPLAEMLRLNGYSTSAFGKWH